MKIEKKLHDFYEDEIIKIEIPEVTCIFTAAEKKCSSSTGTILFRVAIAAVFAVTALPFISSAGKPSVLALRTTEVVRTLSLDSRITEGLLDFNKILYKSFKGE